MGKNADEAESCLRRALTSMTPLSSGTPSGSRQKSRPLTTRA